MLYGFMLLGLFGCINASEYDSAKATGYIPEGRIPDGFTFKKCEERDEECKNSRESFMSQYKKHNKTRKFYIDNNVEVSLTTDSKAVVTQTVKNGSMHISVENSKR